MEQVRRNIIFLLFHILGSFVFDFSAAYTFYSFNFTWLEAQTYCRTQDGSLANFAKVENSEKLHNTSFHDVVDAWIGNVVTYEPLNDTEIDNLTEEEINTDNSDYRCLSISVRQLTEDSRLWNYTVEYIPLHCDSQLPSICLFRISGIKRWMVQPTKFSWWKRTKSRHCLNTWPPEHVQNFSSNILGTTTLTFNTSVLDVGKSYWIRKILKLGKKILNTDGSHVLKCGLWDKNNNSLKYGACDNRRGFICNQESGETSSRNPNILVSVTIAALVIVGSLIGIVLFCMKRKSGSDQAASPGISGKSRVWRKPATSDILSDTDPRTTMYAQVIPPSHRRVAGNRIGQHDATYDRTRDDSSIYDDPNEHTDANPDLKSAAAQLNVQSLYTAGYMRMDCNALQNLDIVKEGTNYDASVSSKTGDTGADADNMRHLSQQAKEVDSTLNQR